MTGLFGYKLLFTAELLVGEMLFCFRLKRRRRFLLRFLLALLIVVAVALVIPVPFYNALYTSFIFLTIFLVSFFSMWLCFDEPWENLFFCCIAGYSIQHLAYECYNLIMNLLGLGEVTLNMYGGGGTDAIFFGMDPLSFVLYLAVYVPIYLCAWLIFSRQIRQEELQLKSRSLLGLSVAIILFDIVMNALIIYRVDAMEDDPARFIRITASVYNAFCCLLALLIQFTLSGRKHLQGELELQKQLRRKEQEQYERLKQNIDLINMKCHDIKHQISTIGRRSMLLPEYVQEMEEAISIYDCTVKTGNDTLDIILTEKSLLCNHNGIRFSCIADAASLNFMNESDLYSFFGNLIDNAIESTLRLDAEKRVIGLQVRRSEGIVVNVYNNFDGPLIFRDGLPVTTKKDSGSHGYGLMSVRAICEKYGGTLSIHPHENIFEVTITFPVTSNS